MLLKGYKIGMKINNLFKILTLLFSLVATSEAKAQDPAFTQFYANPIYLNPAFAGSHGCPRVNMNHRNQWPSISGAFVTNKKAF